MRGISLVTSATIGRSSPAAIAGWALSVHSVSVRQSAGGRARTEAEPRHAARQPTVGSQAIRDEEAAQALGDVLGVLGDVGLAGGFKQAASVGSRSNC